MKNFHELLLTRHSIRKYTDEPINADDVKTILEAGLMAPTSKRSTAWNFIVVEDKEVLRQLSECRDAGATPIAGSALTIVVTVDMTRSEAWVEDGAIAATLMQLQAHDLGLGSCWINREREMFATDEGKRLMKEWGLPDGLIGIGAISVGYPAAEPAAPKPRKSDYIRILH